MTTPAKLYGKDLSEYDDIDVDTLLAQLSAEEISILAKEVDPDVSTIAQSKVARLPITVPLLGLVLAARPTHQLRLFKITDRATRPQEADRSHQQASN